MKRKELVQHVCAETGLTVREGQKVVDAVLDGILKGCREDQEVVLRAFGKFTVIERPARKVVYTIGGGGEKMIPARKGLVFKASANSL